MADQFFDAIKLIPKNKHHHVVKSRPLTLEINLKPQTSWENVQWTPKTPCSMLSPLTPKYRRFDLSASKIGTPEFTYSPTERNRINDFEDDPSLALMMIDITSNLGKRISSQMSLLLNLHSCAITTDYDRYCNRGEQPVDPDARKLRSLEGRILPAYRKRHCHRYVDRVYYFKPSEKRERGKTLLTGLNKASRRLLRRMRTCTLVVEKIIIDPAKIEDIHIVDDPVLRLLHNAAVPVVCLPRIKYKPLNDPQVLFDEKPNGAIANGTQKLEPSARLQKIVVSTPVISKRQPMRTKHPSHRKSVRRRKTPRRLLHSM